MSNNPPEYLERKEAGTEAQFNRRQALQRFNRLFVYLPLALFLGASVGIFGLFIWFGVVNPLINQSSEIIQYQTTASGLADVIFILFSLPLFIMLILMPALLIAGITYSKKEGKHPLKQLQILIWKAENGLLRVAEKSVSFTAKIGNQSEKINARFYQTETKFNRYLIGNEAEIQ